MNLEPLPILVIEDVIDLDPIARLQLERQKIASGSVDAARLLTLTDSFYLAIPIERCDRRRSEQPCNDTSEIDETDKLGKAS